VRRAESPHRKAGAFSLQITVIVAFGVMMVVSPYFRTLGSLQTILTQASFAGLIACGMTLLIVAGMIDLSVAGLLAMSAVVAATVIPRVPFGIAVAAALMTGVVLGLVNGLVVTKLKIPSFIATLGMLDIYIAAAFIWTDGNVQPIASARYRSIGTSTILGVPIPFWVFAAVCAVSWIILKQTPLGREVRAIGSSEVASRMAGIRVDRVVILLFAFAGFTTAVAAVTLSALLSSANGGMALGIELEAIAIAVVGGTSLRGGAGDLLGTFTAAILFAAMDSGLNLLGVASYWQTIAVGVVLVLALAIGARRRIEEAPPGGEGVL